MNLLKRYRLLMVLMHTGFIGNLIVIYYLSKGLSYAQIGLATALTAWGIVLLEVPTGIVGDRVSRKLSVLIGLTLNAIATLVLIFLNGFAMLLLYALLMALSIAFVSGSLQAWLFDTMRHLGREKEFREFMKGTKSLTIPVSALTLVTGAFLAQLYGFTLPLVLSFIIEVAMVVLALSIPEYGFEPVKEGYGKHTLRAFRELFSWRIFPLVAISIFVSLETNQFRKFFEPYLGNVLALYLGTTIMGTLGILGIAEVTVRTLPRLVGIRIRDSWSLRLYSLTPVLVPALTVLSVLYKNPVWIVLLGLAVTVVSTAFQFNVSVELQHRLPSERRATILSADSMVSALAMGSFHAGYGFAVNALGLTKARLLFALVLLIIGLLVKVLEVLGPLKNSLELEHVS
ncbi:MFS transporter [Thermococcus gammatolerans]|uniref:Permease, major facilitator superfamily n=1 Tax=Thermococcus gammatolerans (strain DSM 15229 / JCM 11827 / EJ3) TaxID=593117 RepID=C5A794_THEGJ|nr:MFS transporter [Thermococcus gammatolerans]ACS34106.1 Permease, major facilitator superfamily [Thermococcus gammatolerans EJ3]